MHELLAIWTQTDPAARQAAIASHYHADVVFHDPDGTFTGHAGIAGFSDHLQERFPGNHFELTAGPEVVGDALRAFWRFGPVSGMDFAILREGRVQTLYAFVQRPGS